MLVPQATAPILHMYSRKKSFKPHLEYQFQASEEGSGIIYWKNIRYSQTFRAAAMRNLKMSLWSRMGLIRPQHDLHECIGQWTDANVIDYPLFSKIFRSHFFSYQCLFFCKNCSRRNPPLGIVVCIVAEQADVKSPQRGSLKGLTRVWTNGKSWAPLNVVCGTS